MNVQDILQHMPGHDLTPEQFRDILFFRTATLGAVVWLTQENVFVFLTSTQFGTLKPNAGLKDGAVTVLETRKDGGPQGHWLASHIKDHPTSSTYYVVTLDHN